MKRAQKFSAEARRAAIAEAAETRRAALVGRSQANPNEFFTFEECGLILGFGKMAMGCLNASGAPVAFRKMNPALIRDWIAQNPQLVAKINAEDE